MTEELEKEAEEYRKEKLNERKDKFVFELPEVYIADIKQAYLAGAEPREKRIADLEAQIEKMKCCYNCKYWEDGNCHKSANNLYYFCADFVCDEWELRR